VRPGQRGELRVTVDLIASRALTADAPPTTARAACWPAFRAARRSAWIIDETHWDGLSTGIPAPPSSSPLPERMPVRGAQERESNPPAALLAGHPAAGTAVTTRPRAAYERVAGLQGRG
jgi:hypothetical protein